MKRLLPDIEKIENPVLRQITTDALKIATDRNPYFLTAPSSESGKYHPEDECAPGGLILHTRRAVAWGLEICRAWDMSPAERDQVVAALVLHDAGKRPKDDIAAPYLEHPERAVEYFLAAVFPMASAGNGTNYSKADLLAVTAIAGAIRLHMGPWTDERHRQPLACYNEVERAVYTADYCASRRELPGVVK